MCNKHAMLCRVVRALLIVVMGSFVAGSLNAANGSSGFGCPDLKKSEDLDLNLSGPTVLVFYGKTCGACHMIQEAYGEFSAKNKTVQCLAVDANAAGVQELKKLFKIDNLPTTVVIHKSVGGMGKEDYLQELSGMTGVPFKGQMVSISEEVAVEKEPQSMQQKPASQKPAAQQPVQPEDDEYTIDAEELGMTDVPLSVTPEEIMPVPVEMQMDYAKTASART